MNILKTILKVLDGKKTIIVGVIALTASYLVIKNIITDVDAAYINGILVILGGSASIATKALFKK